MAAMRVAIVGSGISGLATAHALRGHADVSLFEAGDYFGGHTHTVDLTLPTPGGLVTHGVDTGFLVFNERTYPQLIGLLGELDVASAPSDMSFSVQVPGLPDGDGGKQRTLEWSGTNLGGLFAQRRNLLDRQFWGMLADLLRFNRLVTRLAVSGQDDRLTQPLGEFLRAQGFGDAFRDWYFLPMMGCIWSCPTDQMLRFPVATMVRFCHNHGLAQIRNRPQWRTVTGGAARYVERIVAAIPDKRLRCAVRHIERTATGVLVASESNGQTRVEPFDHVVLGTHSDQALALITDPSAAERETLGAIRYQPNRAVLHTDPSVLPRNRAAWAAWNYERAADAGTESAQVCLHYLLNRLQPLPWAQPVIVSLNPLREIARNHVMGSYDYAHPVFDRAAIEAQRRVPSLQGHGNVWFCGAWMGYGFHEDGLKAGLGVAQQLLARSSGRQEAPA